MSGIRHFLLAGLDRTHTLVSKQRAGLPHICAHLSPLAAVCKTVNKRMPSIHMRIIQHMPTTYLFCCTLNPTFSPSKPSLFSSGRKTSSVLTVTFYKAASTLRAQPRNAVEPPPLTVLWTAQETATQKVPPLWSNVGTVAIYCPILTGRQKSRIFFPASTVVLTSFRREKHLIKGWDKLTHFHTQE